jgi:hypothetical protein
MIGSRTLGIILLVVGFVTAVGAGLFFAIQAQSATAITDVFSSAILVFIGILPFLVGGVYLYNRSAEPQISDSDVTRQLLLLDYLREQRGEVSIAQLSDALQASEQEIRQALRDLITQDLFSGYWDETHDRVCLIATGSLELISSCVVCNESLALTYLPYECGSCGTRYYSTVV